MFGLGDHRPESRPHTTAMRSRLRAGHALPSHRYVLRIGSVDFAYTTCDRYLRALGQAWAAGLVPDPLPSSGVRDLGGIDLDISALSHAETYERA